MDGRNLVFFILFTSCFQTCDCTCGNGLFGSTKICNNPCGAYKFQDMNNCGCLDCPQNSGSTCSECCSVTVCSCNPNFTSTKGSFPCVSITNGGNMTTSPNPLANGSVACIPTSIRLYLILVIINFVILII